jgi:hypothetical protein
MFVNGKTMPTKSKKINKIVLFNDAVRALVATGVTKHTASEFCKNLDVMALFTGDRDEFAAKIVELYNRG